MEEVSVREWAGSPDPEEACLDADRLRFPLVVRRWGTGDRMQPLGMHGRRKVSDMLIDQKVSNIQKDRTHVWVSDGEVVWLAGIRIAHPARVTPQTKRVWRIRRTEPPVA